MMHQPVVFGRKEGEKSCQKTGAEKEEEEGERKQFSIIDEKLMMLEHPTFCYPFFLQFEFGGKSAGPRPQSVFSHSPVARSKT